LAAVSFEWLRRRLAVERPQPDRAILARRGDDAVTTARLAAPVGLLQRSTILLTWPQCGA